MGVFCLCLLLFLLPFSLLFWDFGCFLPVRVFFFPFFGLFFKLRLFPFFVPFLLFFFSSSHTSPPCSSFLPLFSQWLLEALLTRPPPHGLSLHPGLISGGGECRRVEGLANGKRA